MTNKRHRLLTYNYLRVSSSGFFLKAVAIDLAGTWNHSKPGSQVFLICFSAHFLLPFLIFIIVLSTWYPPHTPPAMKSSQWRSILLLWFWNNTERSGKVENEHRWQVEKDRGWEARKARRKAWPGAMESCNRCYVSSRRIKSMWAFIWN